MRSKDSQHITMWTTVSTENLVPADHPLRAIRTMVNAVLADLSPDFAKLYSPFGRPSIAPEKQLRAVLLQMFYTIRSERQLLGCDRVHQESHSFLERRDCGAILSTGG